MKKTYVLFVLFLMAGVYMCKAQDALSPHTGIITLKDGAVLKGVILIHDNMPWYSQRSVLFLDSASYAKNNGNYSRSKRYSVADMQQYQVENKIYDKVHYVNIENLQLKSLGSNDHMLERLTVGRITSHRFYDYPADFAVESGTADQVAAKEAQRENDLMKGFKILCVKDGETKQQNAFDIDLLKYLADVPAVQQKYQEGGYGNQPVEKHRGLGAKMLAYAKKSAFKQEEADAIISAFNDYNAQSPAK